MDWQADTRLGIWDIGNKIAIHGSWAMLGGFSDRIYSSVGLLYIRRKASSLG